MSLKYLSRNTDRQSVDHLSDLFRNLGNSLELEDIFSTLDEELRRLLGRKAREARARLLPPASSGVPQG